MSEAFSFDFSEEEIDRVVDSIFVPSRTERGVGFCQKVLCEEFCKPKLLYHHEGDFFCTLCHQMGFIVPETGRPNRKPGQLFGEVRLEYCYCPAKKRYQEVAIVRDTDLGDDIGTYTVQNPLINTEKRALQVAEALLALLNDGMILDEDLAHPPHTKEKVLDLDLPLEDVKRWLGEFALQVRDNPFYHKRTK